MKLARASTAGTSYGSLAVPNLAASKALLLPLILIQRTNEHDRLQWATGYTNLCIAQGLFG